MPSNNRAVGLKEIFLGVVPTDGATMPEESTMIKIEEVKVDSVVREQEDNTIEDIKDLRDGSIDMALLTEEGNTTVVFETRDMTNENKKLIAGGSVIDGKWLEPTETYKGVEKCLRVVTDPGKGLHAVSDFIRVLVTGKVVNNYSNGEPGTFMMTCKKLSPEDASGDATPASIEYFKPAAPTNGVVEDTADTFGWDNVEGFDLATEYEYCVDYLTTKTWSDCTVNPQTGISTAEAVGDVAVRVKKNTSATYPIQEGYVLTNKAEFTV